MPQNFFCACMCVYIKNNQVRQGKALRTEVIKKHVSSVVSNTILPERLDSSYLRPLSSQFLFDKSKYLEGTTLFMIFSIC